MRRVRGLLWCLVCGALQAETQMSVDPNMANPDYVSELVTVNRGAYTMAGLVSRPVAGKPVRHGIALFPGHPGMLRLRQEADGVAFDLRGNFLVRSRRHWLDQDTLVVMVDAPSDEWAVFSQYFRTKQRYGEDVAALLQAVGLRYGVVEWTAVGTSEGSVSAFHAARMNPQLIGKVILSASVLLPSRNGPGLSDVDWGELKQPLLWVHHVDDPCRATPYRSAEKLAAQTASPLITVRGSDGVRGDACQAFTQHGFVGVEMPTVAAMRHWVKTGEATREVNR
ncbi:MAG: hypothetical protein D3M94_00920 [Rhodocyclales bacterium GT-UBC]|nr:MAG: hypothetical protein D3M94_00920 [Rhodocyclales bacterium GT-UBC]